jgi:hypothetical protein
MSTLQNEVLFVMLGLEPASDFPNNVSKELNVDKNKANTITRDINELVLGPIRTHLQQWEDQTKKETTEEQIENKNLQDLTILEQAGSFTIEKEAGQNSNNNNANTSNGFNTDSEVTAKDKDRILNDIEFPTASNERVEDKNQENGELGNLGKEYPHTEPLVDQLLGGTTANVEKKVTVSSPLTISVTTTPTSKPVEVLAKPTEMPPKPKGPDMYRESIK